MPDGWRWERLGDLVEKSSAKHQPDKESRLPFVGLEHIPPHEMRIEGVGSFADMRSAGSAFLPGDVLYGRLRPYLNKVWVADRAGACSGELIVLRPKSGMNARYVALNLHSQRYVYYASHIVTGDRPRIDFDLVGAFPVPVPDEGTQRQVVARIDALFAEIGEGEAALAEARAGVETYRKALLKAAVTGELTADWRAEQAASGQPQETGEQLLARILANRRARWHADPKNARKTYTEPAGPDTDGLPELPEGWAWASLQQLGDFGRGKSKHRPRNDPKLYGGPYPFIQTGIVAESDGDIARFEQTYTEMGKAQSKLWPAGTLCITIAANIAKTGVLTFDACFPDSIVGLTCADGVNPRYVELFIRTVREELDRWAPATAQKNINLETLYEVAVPLPSTTEQARIVTVAREETGLETTLEDAGLEALASTLRQSILAAAFRGELSA
ncbi:restriction endonuclease subunit S [Novosphingobium sp. SL115]|uniref:restriction endonuclease subunit S n=1 Tax=Novosphingobium sp. SL115 TaxID=2995150 RepID=UPI0022755623|nr:restriction endonuclease subunit S [Novosphingobium sp. SL115]MCY1670174.1 restriction endonuclease subunit S [Novosphingobium sp. SL115]